MKSEKVYCKKGESISDHCLKFDGCISNDLMFYLQRDGKSYYLFTQKFSKGVYEFFKNGITWTQVLSYSNWNKNPRLDKTVQKLPLYRGYILREVL